MLKAKDIMTKDLIVVAPEMEISKAAKILLENRINGMPVVDESGRLVGILCQSDIVAQQKKFPIPSVFTFLDSLIPLSSGKQLEREVRKIAATTVAHAMTSKVVTVSPETGIEEVAELMVDKNYHTIPVMDKTGLAGIIGKEDILKTLINGANDPISGAEEL
jgi:CBS-domain-containing membrane protein